MDLLNVQPAAKRLKAASRLRPTLAIILGSGFHHVLTELHVEKKFPTQRFPVFQNQPSADTPANYFLAH